MNNQSIKGYTYIAGSETDNPLIQPIIGQNYVTPGRKPPFIIIDHTIESVIVAKWPGKLWYTEVTDPVTHEEEEANEWGTTQSDCWYTRAFGVHVLKEVPVEELFGTYGKKVVGIIMHASRMDITTAKKLSDARHSKAEEAYSHAWEKWITKMGEEATRTISPVNSGFSVLYNQLSNRAKALEGNAAYYMDEDGDECLNSTWSGALSAMMHAMMALGAPYYVEISHLKILTKAWNEVMSDQEKKIIS